MDDLPTLSFLPNSIISRASREVFLNPYVSVNLAILKQQDIKITIKHSYSIQFKNIYVCQ